MLDEWRFTMDCQWSAVYEGGYIKPYWTVNPLGQVHLEWADLYNSEGEQKGTWSRKTMPNDIIRHIEATIKSHRIRVARRLINGETE